MTHYTKYTLHFHTTLCNFPNSHDFPMTFPWCFSTLWYLKMLHKGNKQDTILLANTCKNVTDLWSCWTRVCHPAPTFTPLKNCYSHTIPSFCYVVKKKRRHILPTQIETTACTFSKVVSNTLILQLTAAFSISVESLIISWCGDTIQSKDHICIDGTFHFRDWLFIFSKFFRKF